MVHKFAILCWLSTIFFQQAYFLPETKLIFSSVIFRHGNRSPDKVELNQFPQLATNNTYQPIGTGQLTNQGKYHMYSNGVMVRKRYNGFLGDVVEDGNVITYVTNYTRTAASALAFLAGLFPPSREQQWTPKCKLSDFICKQLQKPKIAKLWNPIPYIYDSSVANDMVSYNLECPAFINETNKVRNLPEIKQKQDTFAKLYEYITANTGIKIESELTVGLLVGFILAKKQVGEGKPSWAVPVWDEMMLAADLMYQILFYNDKQKQLSGGILGQIIINDMVAKASGTLVPNNRKLVIYSGHDMTVAALYAALGGSKGFVDLKGNPVPVNYPNFGATIFIELHRILRTDEHGVKILYHNNDNKEPQILKVVECTELCPLDKFIRLTRSTTITKQMYEAICLT